MKENPVYSDERLEQIEITTLPDYMEKIISLHDEMNAYTGKSSIDNIRIKEYILQQVIKELNRKGETLVRDEDYVSLSDKIANVEKRIHKTTHPKYYEYKSRKLFFRGETDCIRKALPSIFRNNDCEEYELNWEDYYYKQINIMCPEIFAGKTHLEHLVRMQHYGCYTRLLDITANPLVALYFACLRRKDKDGVVYIYAPRTNEIKAFDSDTVLNLACLSPFSMHDKDAIYDEVIKRITCTNKTFNDDKCAEIIERLYHEIKTEKPAYDKKLDPVDLLTPVFVQPERDNRRIEKQDGAFIIVGLAKDLSSMASVIHRMTWKMIVIPKDRKKDILNELYNVGINQAALFPEIESVSEFLKEEVIRQSYNCLPGTVKEELKESGKLKKYSFI